MLDKIIAAAEITKDDFVLEIGPGIGTLTQYLAEAAREVVAVEIDSTLIPILEDTLSAYDNVSVINEDVLKVDLRKLAEEKRRQTHQSSGKSALLHHDPDYHEPFESHVPLKSLTVMVQKEVALRMQAGPAPRITALFPWRFSIMRAPIWQQMCRPTALCPDLTWAAR